MTVLPDQAKASEEAGPETLWRTGPTWLASDHPLPRWVGRQVAWFMRVEAASGIVLGLATVVALLWANSTWSDTYEALWSTEVGLQVGDFGIAHDLRRWVNDGLMVVFFLVVGLEIKGEITTGHLRDPRRAAVPIMAALGGMVVPAAVYSSLNRGGGGASGWGIPMATDIAFALGVVALLGRRIPIPARAFLLTTAIVDDIGAVAVIGIFYTADVSLTWLLVAVGGLVAIVMLRALRVWSFAPYVVLGAVVWLATELSGVHATIAGVALGLLTPAKPLLNEEAARRHALATVPERLDAGQVRRFRFLMSESVPVSERLEHALHPWASFVVLPLFALANAGIDLRGGLIEEAVTSAVGLGVMLGLVVGKPAGVLSAAWLTVRLGLGRLPPDTSWKMIAGLAALAGIGFTMSLFVAGLAFPSDSLAVSYAKVGILAGSATAALLGAGLLRAASGAENPRLASGRRDH